MGLTEKIWNSLSIKDRRNYLLRNNLITESNFLLHLFNYESLINELNKGKNNEII